MQASAASAARKDEHLFAAQLRIRVRVSAASEERKRRERGGVAQRSCANASERSERNCEHASERSEHAHLRRASERSEPEERK